MKRYDIGPGARPQEHAIGSWVMQQDAVADKAEAVAEAVNEATEALQAERDELLVEAAAVAGAVEAERKKTAELRAELVVALTAGFAACGYREGELRIHADHTFDGAPTVEAAKRLVILGAWKRLADDGKYQCYRPIEQGESNDD